MSDSLKKWAIYSFAHFWWATWAICSQLFIPKPIAHGHSFFLSDLLTLLRRNERNFFFIYSKKTVKNIQKIRFFYFFWVNRSFFVSESLIFLWAKEEMSDLLKKPKRFAHLSWASPSHSHLLICPEQFEQMSEWANSLPWGRIWQLQGLSGVQFDNSENVRNGVWQL